MKKKLDRGLNPMKRPLRSSYVFFVFFCFFECVCVCLEIDGHMKEGTAKLKGLDFEIMNT